MGLNTFNGTTTINLNQDVLSGFNKRLMGLGIFTRDYSGDIVQGDSVVTRVVSKAGTPITRGATVGYNDSTIVEAITTTPVTIQLTEKKVIGFTLSADEYDMISNGIITNITKDRITSCINAVAKQMLGFVFGKITVANFAKSLVAGDAVAFDYKDTADHAAVLDAADYPIEDIAYVLNPSYIAALAKDNVINQMYSSGLSVIVDGSGAITRVSGMPLHKARTLQTTENLVGFACDKNALAIAMRAPMKGGMEMPSGASAEILTDSDTGLSLTHYRFFDAPMGRWNMTYEAQYGASVALADNLHRIVSQ